MAIVTGSARGLGAATAKRLAEEGAKVIVTDILPDLAEATAASLRDAGLAAHCIIADVTNPADVQTLVEQTIATFGGLHILVNNAGFPRDGFLTKMSEEDWDLVLKVILKGSFLTCKAVMPHFIEQQWGRIVN
ncbi:MAG: SDR family NAD(P)-dependent oxidoreductase, partial [Rhodopila sp.]|nr:SDR family NAD(P)-dependent oxidoreductase [Rhodopila sp.]